jgi:hypothetical protein
VFEGDEEIVVELLLFATGRMLQALALFDGVVLLGVGSATVPVAAIGVPPMAFSNVENIAL